MTYAKQDRAKHDDVPGPGNGFINVFDTSGNFLRRLVSNGNLNAPWGLALVEDELWVGNFRSGWIAAFNGFTHKFIGFLKNPDDSLVFIDGIWSLTFGNDGAAGSANTLFFSAGINNENDGLFGTLTPVDGLDGDEE